MNLLVCGAGEGGLWVSVETSEACLSRFWSQRLPAAFHRQNAVF